MKKICSLIALILLSGCSFVQMTIVSVVFEMGMLLYWSFFKYVLPSIKHIFYGKSNKTDQAHEADETYRKAS